MGGGASVPFNPAESFGQMLSDCRRLLDTLSPDGIYRLALQDVHFGADKDIQKLLTERSDIVSPTTPADAQISHAGWWWMRALGPEYDHLDTFAHQQSIEDNLLTRVSVLHEVLTALIVT